MNAQDFLRDFFDGTKAFIRSGRADLAAWTQREDIVALTTQFLAERNEDQLAILSFRLRTWARTQNVKAIVKMHQQLGNFIEILGNIVIKAIA